MRVAPPSDNYFSIETYFISSAVKKYFTTCITHNENRKEVIDYPWRTVPLTGFLGKSSEQEVHRLVGEHTFSGRLVDCFVGCCVADSMAGLPLANNDTFAAESTSAVVFMSGGLAYPSWR